MLCYGWNMDPLLYSRVKSAVSWVGSKEWIPCKASKTQIPACKVLAFVFWNAHGILFIDYLEKGRIINSEYDMALLRRSKEEIAKKRPKWRRQKCSFIKAMKHVTSRSQQWQNFTNCTLNSSSTKYSRPDSQRLQPVCWPKKNAPGKKIWPQGRSDCCYEPAENKWILTYRL